MTLAWLFPPEADRRLLPGGRMRGPTTYVIAIMTFTMIVIASAGLALANAAGIVARGAEARYSVQLPAGADSAAALAAIRSIDGIGSAELVPEQEMRRTLERWLGPAGAEADLPVPALVHVDAAAGTGDGRLQAEVERRVPGARLIAHSESLKPLLRSLTALQWLALALVALMAAATGAAVVLAARGALDTHRSTIEVMHGVGATDIQVTHLFQRKIALDAVVGALAGSAAAAEQQQDEAGGALIAGGDIVGRAPLGPRDLFVLLLLPVAVVILATWVARSAVLAALRRAL